MTTIDQLTAQIEEIEREMERIANEIQAKRVERVNLFKKQEELKQEKLRLLGWD